jgi:hypothetical protein
MRFTFVYAPLLMFPSHPCLIYLISICAACHTDADCGSSPDDSSKRCIQHADTGMPVTRDGYNVPEAELLAHTLSYCIEKNLFSPFTRADAFASFMAFLSAALGSGCGVGGGGLLVPLYILVVGLGPKHAIPLSKATIFGGAIATFLVNSQRKHPCRAISIRADNIHGTMYT